MKTIPSLGVLSCLMFRINAIHLRFPKCPFVRASFLQNRGHSAFSMDIRCSSSYSGSISDDETSGIEQRKKLLHASLSELGMDADGLEAAAVQSSNDGRYGTSVIKTCRSFYTNEKLSGDLRAAALRTARQIQFLYEPYAQFVFSLIGLCRYKRHESHKAEWIRHHDQVQKQIQRFPLILVLDNVRSATNVGNLFRTADAVGCSSVITVGITPHPNGSGAEKLAKSALGAEITVASRHFASLVAAIHHLRTEYSQYQILGVETTEKSIQYTDFSFGDAVALVLGNEVTGVDADMLLQLDGIVEIPMFGAKNSLNVAVCAPIILYEVHRQWNQRSKG